jgi:hypothetical protein
MLLGSDLFDSATHPTQLQEVEQIQVFPDDDQDEEQSSIVLDFGSLNSQSCNAVDW